MRAVALLLSVVATSGAATRPQAQPQPSRAPTGPPKAALLEGVIQAPDGKGIASARIIVTSASGPASRKPIVTQSETDGRFRIAVPGPGPFVVGVWAARFASRNLEGVKAGAPLVVALRAGPILEGVVRNKGGEPVPGALVRVADFFGAGDLSENGPATQTVETVTDSRGRFRLEGSGPGAHTVTAWAHGLGSAREDTARPGRRIDLYLTRSGTIAGTVVDSSGQPLARALVWAESPRRGTRSAETTDKDGRFQLVGLEPGTWSVLARHSDQAPGLSPGLEVDREAVVEATIALSPGAAVKGRLVGADEQPAPGSVELQLGEDEDPHHTLRRLLNAEAGPDGLFLLERVPLGSFVLAARSPGRGQRRLDLEVSPRDGPIDLGDVLLELGLTIRGRVRSVAGAPIGEAQLSAHTEAAIASRSETRSEADGSFVIAGLKAGLHELNANAPGYARYQKTQVASGTEGVDVVLSPGGAIVALVVDEMGRPVETLIVSLYPATADGSWNESSVGGRYPEGRFRQEGLTAGDYVLQVSAPDFTPATRSPVTVRAGGETDAGTIALARGSTVRGVVVDSAGTGLGGARVGLNQTGLDRVMNALEATTDPSGIFELRGITAGTKAVLAQHADYAPASTSVQVDPPREPPDLRIALTAGGRIEGVARRRGDVPLAGADVDWTPIGPGREALDISGPTATQTRADGSFTIEHLPPGSAQVRLTVPGAFGHPQGMLLREVAVREGQTTRVEFMASEILVRGRVTRRGEPLAGARVRFMGGGGGVHYGGRPADGGVPSEPQRLYGTTASDGSYELIVDAPGSYHVRVANVAGRQTLPSLNVDVPDVETHTVDLAFTTAVVSGVVIDEEANRGVAGAQVLATPESGRSSGTSGRSDDDGAFELEAEPGVHTLRATAKGYAPGDVRVDVGDSGLGGVRLLVARGLQVSGRVVDAAARGVAGVTVATRLQHPEHAQAGFWTHGHTLPDGSFHLGDLPPGLRVVCAGSGQGYAVRGGVSGETKDVLLMLRPPGRVRVNVIDGAGAPVRGAWVRVWSVDDLPMSPFEDSGATAGATDEAGRIELRLPAGDLQLEAWNSELGGSARVTLPEGGLATAQVKLVEPRPKP